MAARAGTGRFQPKSPVFGGTSPHVSVIRPGLVLQGISLALPLRNINTSWNLCPGKRVILQSEPVPFVPIWAAVVLAPGPHSPDRPH